jgi:type IV pilus assembly protein PilW
MRKPHGLTLLEMMIALGVSSLAIAAALVMVQAQQRTFYGGQRSRQAQGGGRSALLYLEQKVPLAGFGMDPAQAFDFAWFGCAAGPSSCPRDLVNGPDELVFYARNPAYRVVDGGASGSTTFAGHAWRQTGLTSSSLSLEARGGELFPKGQILQIVCGDELRFTYVTVQATTSAPPAPATGPLDIAIEPVSPSTLARNTAAHPFRRQDMADQANVDAKQWNGCFVGGTRVFLIDRYRFHVQVVNMGGGRMDPYLALDQGIDRDGNGSIDTDDELLVAEGIENFQVTYVFANPALPPAGTTPGTAIAVRNPGAAADTTANVITPTNFPGNYDATRIFPPLHSSQFFVRSSYPLEPSRLTNDQGNIRAVRIALVARSPEPDPTGSSNLRYAANSPLWLMNFNALPAYISDYLSANGGNDRYLRAILNTTLEVPNLAARGILPN